MLHSFENVQNAKLAVANDSKVDRTVCPTAPAYNDGDVLECKDTCKLYVVYRGEVRLPHIAGNNAPDAERDDVRLLSSTDGHDAARAVRKVVDTIHAKRREAEDARKRVQVTDINRQIANMCGPRGKYVDGRLLIDDQPVYCYDIREDYTAGWRGTSKGTHSVTVRIGAGRSAETKRFPQRKDGSHNYAGIALMLLRQADRQKEQRTAERIRAANKAVVNEEFQKGFKVLKGYYVVAPSALVDQPVFVKFEIQRTMTVEQVRALDEALASTGLFNK